MYITEIEDERVAASFSQGYVSSHDDLLRLRAARVLSVLIDTSKTNAPKIWRPKSFRYVARDLEMAKDLLNETGPALGRAFAGLLNGNQGSYDESRKTADAIASMATLHPSAIVGVTRLKRLDQMTYLHSISVGALMIMLSRRLGYSESDCLTLGLAGIYHDVGKLRIDKRILSKTGQLTTEEMEVIKTHPRHGFDLLRRDSDVPDVVLDVCLHHHEKLDGTGYPLQLAGSQISQAARIGAICDVYDALTTIRPYKRAWKSNDALELMSSSPGHFDQLILAEFRSLIVELPDRECLAAS